MYRYDELIARWLANGRRLPKAPADGQPDHTIIEIVAAYWRHAQAYYVKFGEPTGEQTNILHMSTGSEVRFRSQCLLAMARTAGRRADVTPWCRYVPEPQAAFLLPGAAMLFRRRAA